MNDVNIFHNVLFRRNYFFIKAQCNVRVANLALFRNEPGE